MGTARFQSGGGDGQTSVPSPAAGELTDGKIDRTHEENGDSRTDVEDGRGSPGSDAGQEEGRVDERYHHEYGNREPVVAVRKVPSHVTDRLWAVFSLSLVLIAAGIALSRFAEWLSTIPLAAGLGCVLQVVFLRLTGDLADLTKPVDSP